MKKLVYSLLCVALLAFSALGNSVSHQQLKSALEHQHQLTQENPSAEAYNDLGSLLQMVGQREEAKAAFDQAIDWDPSNTTARLNLARLLHAEGENRQALKILDDLLELESEHAWAHFTRGVIQEERGRRRSAIQAYAKAFRIDPNLSLAEVNPQIVDSRYMTEALLKAFDSTEKGDPGLQPFFQSAISLETVVDEEPPPPVEGESYEPEEEVEHESQPVFQPKRSAQSPQSSNRVIGPGQLEDSKVGQATPIAGSSSSNRSSRGRTSKKSPSLRDHLKTKYGTRDSKSKTETQEKDGQRGSSTAGSTRNPRKINEENEKSQPQPQGFRRGTYRPSRFSTGSLDLELVPIDPAGA